MEYLKQNGVEGYDNGSLNLVDKNNRPLYSFKILKEFESDKDDDFFREEKKNLINNLNPLYGRGKNTEKSRITVRKYTKSELNIKDIRQQEDIRNLKPRQLFDLNIKKPSMDVVWNIYNENFLKEPYNMIEAITKKRILEVSEVYFDRLYKTSSNPCLRYAVSNILYLSLPFLSEQRIIEVCETYSKYPYLNK